MLLKFTNWSKGKGFHPCELIITIFIVITVITWGLIIYFTDSNLGINGLGDFFAGIFTPIAFYWLIRGYMLQKQELQQNTLALELQSQELRNSVEEYKQMVEVNRAQLSLYRYETVKPKLKPQIIVEYSVRPFRIKEPNREPYDIFLCMEIENSGGMAKDISADIGNGIIAINIPSLDGGQCNKQRKEISKEAFLAIKRNDIAQISYTVGYDEYDEFGSFDLSQPIEFIERK